MIAAGIVYIGSGVLGLPYVFFMRGMGWLNYWTIMVPTLILATTVVILEQASLWGALGVGDDIGVMSTTPGVLLAGICFYLLAVWRYEPDGKWTILVSIAFVWLLHFACVAVQKHNFLTSNPISDTGSALGLRIVMRGGRILSLATTIVLACVWLVSYLLNKKLTRGGEFFPQATHRRVGN